MKNVWECGQHKPDLHTNECEFPNKYASCEDDHPVYAKSCENWRRNSSHETHKNIPYHNGRTRVQACYLFLNNPTKNSKCPEKQIVKKLIQLELRKLH